MFPLYSSYYGLSAPLLLSSSVITYPPAVLAPTVIPYW